MKSLSHQATIAVYQTLSPAQLAALIDNKWRTIEPGHEGEHFCYLKLQQRYAEMVARQWTVPVYGAGYVARLILPTRALANYDLETVAYAEHLEYRVPVVELRLLSAQLPGRLELVCACHQHQSYSIPPGSAPLRSLIG